MKSVYLLIFLNQYDMFSALYQHDLMSFSFIMSNSYAVLENYTLKKLYDLAIGTKVFPLLFIRMGLYVSPFREKITSLHLFGGRGEREWGAGFHLFSFRPKMVKPLLPLRKFWAS